MFAFGLCFMIFRDGSDGKESACSGRAPGAIPRLGRSSEEGNGYPLQYSCLENSCIIIIHLRIDNINKI